ncbi:MAG: hypothetical protein V2I51_16130 [Anderseniella sp.]|jgi:hypothetical protein|nr:hypothetical protein [Anderseniella sp.]
MKTAVIEINPDWKAALREGVKGMRQAARSGRIQQFTFSCVKSPTAVLRNQPQALGGWTR